VSGKSGSGTPPSAHRFRKGRSGNPKGRPKTKQDPEQSTAFDIIIDKTLQVSRGGELREVTVEEALQHKTYRDALDGNRPARREVLKWIAKREKALAAKRKPVSQDVRFMTEPVDPQNANAALIILGIADRDARWEDDGADPHERLLLEPWAVQMALGRRRGGTRLTPREVSEIKRCTRNASSLRWPRTVADEK